MPKPKLTEAEIAARLTSIFTVQLGVPPETVTPEAKIVLDLNADSLDVVELELAVEEEFDLNFGSDEGVEDLCENKPEATVSDIVQLVKSKL